MNASIALWLYWYKKTARENRAVVILFSLKY